MRISAEELESARTPNGGYRREQLIGWGVPWPPPKGWKRALLTGSQMPIGRKEKLKRRAIRKIENGGFFKTMEWYAVRYGALKQANGRCQCCGQRPTEGNPLHVDHIKPISKFPELALEIANLQVLCAACNLGKSNKDTTDWRGL
jgi:5-methylcytosine-specific restriction endonuclease McrA